MQERNGQGFQKRKYSVQSDMLSSFLMLLSNRVTYDSYYPKSKLALKQIVKCRAESTPNTDQTRNNKTVAKGCSEVYVKHS